MSYYRRLARDAEMSAHADALSRLQQFLNENLEPGLASTAQTMLEDCLNTEDVAEDSPPDFAGKPNAGGRVGASGYERAMKYLENRLSPEDLEDFRKFIGDLMTPKARMAGDRRLAMDGLPERHARRLAVARRAHNEREFEGRFPDAARIEIPAKIIGEGW